MQPVKLSARGNPVLKLKAQAFTEQIGAFKVDKETFDALQSLSQRSGIPMLDILRQMIKFSLEHMQD